MLRTLTLRSHYEARRNVRDTNGGFDLVHVLTALAAGAKGVHLKFVWRDIDFARLLDFSDYVHAAETSVAALIGIEWRNANEPMNAAFGFRVTISVFTFDTHGDAFYAGRFTRQCIFDFALPSAVLGPPLVHPHEHASPIAR